MVNKYMPFRPYLARIPSASVKLAGHYAVALGEYTLHLSFYKDYRIFKAPHHMVLVGCHLPCEHIIIRIMYMNFHGIHQ